MGWVTPGACPGASRLDGKAAASVADLAPMTRESGQWKGRSFIRGRPPKVH